MSQPRLYSDLAWIWPLLSPPEDYVEEAEVLLEEFDRLGAQKGNGLLHLGSGGGSLDRHLKERFDIVGVDLSPEMRAHAATINPEIPYVEGDIRSFRLGETVDAVLIHDAIAYMASMADLRAAFVTASTHLGAGGAFICQPEQIREQYKQHRVRSQTHSRDGLSVTTVEVAYDADPSDHLFETTFAYFIREGEELTVELDRHEMGIFTLAEFASAANWAGLEVEVVQVELSDMPPDEPYTLLAGRKR